MTPENIIPSEWESHRLPHREIGSLPVHIVYRLKDSVPRSEIEKLLIDRKRLYPPKQHMASDLFRKDNPIVGRDTLSQSRTPILTQEEWTEQQFENLLHHHSNGPYHLQDPIIAQIIIDSWLWLQKKRGLYIYAICVMGNHVHVLLQSWHGTPLTIGSIMKAHKNFTAISCNKVLGLSGKSFWEVGYFDRDLRPNQFAKLMWYILNNPVKAGLVKNWKAWPGTYLNPDYRLLF